MKKRFTEEQIIGVLKEAKAGAKVAELCRKQGALRRHASGMPLRARRCLQNLACKLNVTRRGSP